MPFAKGHPQYAHNPGRKKKESTRIKEIYEKNAIAIAAKMVELALAGNVDCLKHCDDRVHGRARQEIDHRLKGKIILSPEEYIQLDRDIDELKEAETKLLEEARIRSSDTVDKPSIQTPDTVPQLG